MVEFSLGADKYTARFSAVIEKIMSSYQMIGEADPFDEDVSHTAPNQSMTPVYIIPPRMISSTAAAQVQAQPPTNKSDEAIALARILAILEKKENASDFNKPAHYHPGGVNPAHQGIAGGEYPFDISNVQCWVCGDNGHFADHCPNEPLPVESQRVLRKTILAEKRRSRRNSLGSEVSTQNLLTILKNSQNQGTTNTNENLIRLPSSHIRFQRAASVQVTHRPKSYQTASECAILAKIPAVKGLLADTLLREGAKMAANQPAGGNRTGAFKDKVIDSRITKKGKQKTISLADLLAKIPQDNEITEPKEPSIAISDQQENRCPSNYPEPPVLQYPSNYPQPPVQQYPSNYPRPPPIQQHPSSYQILSVQETVDEERPEPMIFKNIPIISGDLPTSNPPCRAHRKMKMRLKEEEKKTVLRKKKAKKMESTKRKEGKTSPKKRQR